MRVRSKGPERAAWRSRSRSGARAAARAAALWVVLPLLACGASAGDAKDPAPTRPATPAASATATPAAANDDASGAPAATGVEAIRAFIARQDIDKTNPSWRTRLPKPPQVPFDPTKAYYQVLETNHGQIRIRLFEDAAPMHVSNTIYLTELGFYDGLRFHRVIPGFMAQGGDPLGNGRGGPGYRFDGEFAKGVTHDGPGKLSMANAGPGTDGSQFFLTFTATHYLDGKHTVFGEVTEGLGTLHELEARGSRSGVPSEPLEIRRATIAVEDAPAGADGATGQAD